MTTIFEHIVHCVVVFGLYGTFNSLLYHNGQFSYGPQNEKICLPGSENNKGVDQPVYLRNLVSAIVIHVLESIIYTRAVQI